MDEEGREGGGRVFVLPKAHITHKTQKSKIPNTHTHRTYSHSLKPPVEGGGRNVGSPLTRFGDPVRPSEISPRLLLRSVPIPDDPFRISLHSCFPGVGFGGIRSGLLLVSALLPLLYLVFVGWICFSFGLVDLSGASVLLFSFSFRL